MQHGNADFNLKDMQHRHAAMTCDAARTYSMDIQQGNAGWTYSMGKHHAHVAQAYSMENQHGHA
jgi:hypothetical protein